MSRQYFEDCVIETLAGANTIVSPTAAAITATTITAMFSVAATTIPAVDVRPGRVWRLTAGGIWTNATTGTLTLTPIWGTTSGGVAMGASVAQTVYGTAVTAGAWYMEATCLCRSTSVSTGANAKVICHGHFSSPGIAGTAGSNFNMSFGGTETSVDPTLAGFQMGWTLSVAGSCTPQ